jgi:hypothetical protein
MLPLHNKKWNKSMNTQLLLENGIIIIRLRMSVGCEKYVF